VYGLLVVDLIQVMNIVSMSVYGDDPTYVIGALENAKLMEKIYPGWILRVHVKQVSQEALRQLRDFGCQVVEMDLGLESGMFWRFLPASDTAGFVVFRDSDSRINFREKAAVEAWIHSGKSCHVMRDHRNHHNPSYPIFGGMWGIKGGVIDVPKLMAAWRSFGDGAPKYCKDLDFLRERVWPLVCDDCCVHDFDHPFPPHLPYGGFVGQRFDQYNKGYSD
jgi:3-hydroxymyristoyl/3-hydroxydecanoyl-(acyl carrier protein) dehydratase